MVKRDVVEKHFGAGFADKLDEPYAVLFGKEYSRREIVVDFGISNLRAFRILCDVLGRHGVVALSRLIAIDPFSLYRVKGVGDTTVFVGMCVIDHFGQDADAWWDDFENRPKIQARRRKTA